MRLRSLVPLALLALVACVPSPPEPTPAPAPVPTPAPTPAPTPPPPPPQFAGNWIDAPQTPGDWSYAAGIARFGEPASEPRLTLRCDRAAGAVEIARAGQATALQPIVIRTETIERSVATVPLFSDPASVVAQVPAHDPLLDAMAFSRGRFAIEAAGLPALYVPSYPEVTRVIEDCR